MRTGLIISVLALGLGAGAVSAQSAVVLQQASSTCIIEAPGAENLSVQVIEGQDGTAALRIRKESGATDKTLRLFGMCLVNKLGPGYRVAAVSGTNGATEAKGTGLFHRRPLNTNPACPDHAAVMYSGTLYCIGNQS